VAGEQKQRIILVTGASRGIGRAALRVLAEEGAHIVATARTLEALGGIEAEAKS
jgi:NAD(P)-dependent dehydrogenase (short-subunit alcohol dehydrogenase family)